MLSSAVCNADGVVSFHLLREYDEDLVICCL